jgi:deoxyribose-phosphate aldolase
MNTQHQPINRYLDHAVLKPEMTRDETVAAIRLGRTYETRTVCVKPADIELALEICAGSATEVGTVLSFPHGAGHPKGKAAEARVYLDLRVREIDMVVNYGLVRSGLWEEVRRDISAVSAVTRPAGIILKVILETSELESEAIARATEIAADSGADFVKTSTGFASAGASEEAIRAMLDAAGGRIGVKASGGIRDRARAELFVSLGCGRIGIGYSTTPVICDGATVSDSGSKDAY